MQPDKGHLNLQSKKTLPLYLIIISLRMHTDKYLLRSITIKSPLPQSTIHIGLNSWMLNNLSKMCFYFSADVFQVACAECVQEILRHRLKTLFCGKVLFFFVGQWTIYLRKFKIYINGGTTCKSWVQKPLFNLNLAFTKLTVLMDHFTACLLSSHETRKCPTKFSKMKICM
jgi:hypothetical protein